MKKKQRLDEYLHHIYHLDKNMIQSWILQGYVYVNDQKIIKKNYLINPEEDKIEIKNINEYPSRAAYKLKDAIITLDLRNYIEDHICMDIGASHGGFTKVLLEFKAKKIYAIDVAKGIIDYTLRINPKVVVIEEKNIKDILITDFLEDDFFDIPWFITCDVSFLSVVTVLKKLMNFAKEVKEMNINYYFYGIFLLKPQFEYSKLTEKGVIKNPILREQIINNRIQEILNLNYILIKHFPASIKGTKGNLEEILFLKSPEI